MKTSAIGCLSDVEKLAYVREQILEIEEQTAREQLVFYGLPCDELTVRRLVFARQLFMTLRLREYVP